MLRRRSDVEVILRKSFQFTLTHHFRYYPGTRTVGALPLGLSDEYGKLDHRRAIPRSRYRGSKPVPDISGSNWLRPLRNPFSLTLTTCVPTDLIMRSEWSPPAVTQAK